MTTKPEDLFTLISSRLREAHERGLARSRHVEHEAAAFEVAYASAKDALGRLDHLREERTHVEQLFAAAYELGRQSEVAAGGKRRAAPGRGPAGGKIGGKTRRAKTERWRGKARFALAAIRKQHPDWSDTKVAQEARQRLGKKVRPGERSVWNLLNKS
jgi:hypothetical protein